MIKFNRVKFRYPDAEFELDIPALHIASGEKIAIIGPSGAGKTTLLKLIAGILQPDCGQLFVDGAALHLLDGPERSTFRITRIGFIFQEIELLDYLHVMDNIVHAFRINPVLKLDSEIRARARFAAERVGLSDRLNAMPDTLSQGERQRVAVCRALLTEPDLILADEATGNLDPANKLKILNLLFKAADERQATVVAVTHDHELLPQFDRVVDFMPMRRELSNFPSGEG
ncbi:ATP-binding cassette domain-containing protein [Candidatus Methylospira mobilis]|nr:ATP-binding cassette domain-containing protein [Candidatus Methylospira mobilis]WNV03758.1 ATP-binding cassette domain-containing protein [Candidatus Methylospira mobilis]